MEQVRQGGIKGISFEGVVAKAETRQRMAKAKTQAWIDRVIQEFGPEKGADMIKS